MKILAVGDMPWPRDSGSRIRTSSLLDALGRLGDIDLYALIEPDREMPVVERVGPVSRMMVVRKPEYGYRGLRRLEWAALGRAPIRLWGREWGPLRQQFTQWAGHDYDLAFYSRLDTHVTLGSCVDAPKIVDFDDLEDHKIHARMSELSAEPVSSAAEWLRRRRLTIQLGRDARLWRKEYERAARQAGAVLVCSDLDRRRANLPNAVVIPNGYEPPDAPVGRVEVGEPPTILFQGTLVYPPNVDAAQHLVRRIAPLLRARIPGVQVRLVGRNVDAIRELHDPPRVVVTGLVADMTVELARADLVAVPLRYGSGTRIKILEAFAHRIPVVSTTLGAEGIAAVGDRHLLLADDPAQFAAACERALADLALRRRLTEAAGRLFEHYRLDVVQDRVARLAATVAAGQPVSAG